jgi:hypothetical protein
MTMLPPRSCPILGLAHHCTGGHQTGGARTTRVIGDAMSTAIGSGTKDDPWVLKTAPGVSEYQMYRGASADPPELVCQVGGTQLRYLLSSVDELHAMLRTCDDWVPLGRADEQKPALGGTVEAWGRSPSNPAGGLVRAQEGLPRPFRRVPATSPGGSRDGRARTQPSKQPDARAVVDRLSKA